MTVFPKHKVGKWSVVLVVAMPMFIALGSVLFQSVYPDVPAGASIPEDIRLRPALALSMLAGMACGVGAFITGLIALRKFRERSLLTYISTGIGALLILFLFGEIVSPQ